jgi:predicted nucleic acid-binding protein
LSRPTLTILINFIHLQRLDLLGRLTEYEFVLPEEVRGEITDPNQNAAVRDAIEAGTLRLVVIEDVQTLTLFAELTGLMGRGEAACLSLAITKPGSSPPTKNARSGAKRWRASAPVA